MQSEAYKEMTDPNKPLNPLLKIQVYQWLQDMQQSGDFNMFGMRPELQDNWSLTKKQSTELLTAWFDGSLEKFYKESFPFYEGDA